MKSEIVYTADGSVAGVRHAWAFDEASSAASIREIGAEPKGVITRDDLAPLAQVKVESLKQLDYFTSAKVNGMKEQFDGPKDYWLALEAGVLTLHFTLPFKSPKKAQKIEIEVYDPSYFVDIKLAGNDPVALFNAPSECELSIRRQSWAQAANKIMVTCP